jgi:hypothetical protein
LIALLSVALMRRPLADTQALIVHRLHGGSVAGAPRGLNSKTF